MALLEVVLKQIPVCMYIFSKMHNS